MKTRQRDDAIIATTTVTSNVVAFDALGEPAPSDFASLCLARTCESISFRELDQSRRRVGSQSDLAIRENARIRS
jgi:hypothetical protein